MDLKERLAGKIPAEELALVPTSFDIVGDVAIIKVPEDVEHHKETIADAVLEQHRNVNTVIRKTGERSGEYRNAAYELLKGDSTETMHREHGCRFRLNPTKTYFSERLGHERQRIMENIAPGETVVDMFAGVGPFSIMAARNADAGKVYAFEKNPDAAAYLKKNVALNKVQDNVEVYAGDVREHISAVAEDADRIIMNLPGSADAFIALALEHVKEGGLIHFYSFVPKDELWETAEENVIETFRGHGADIEIADRDICGHYNPAVERVCFDVRVKNKHL